MVLTDSQNDIVYGSICNRAIYAGPGSGKTSVLTQHLAHLLTTRQIAPSQVVALTFTRQAARELVQRLVTRPDLSSAQCATLRIGTFHSFAFHLLMQLGLPVKPLLTHHEQTQLLRDSFGGTPESASAIGERANELAQLHAEWPPAMANRATQRWLAVYERGKARVGKWDFDDILRHLCEQSAGKGWDRVPRITYVLVDEFQDTNQIQLYILHMLQARFNARLLVVGDEDQAVYGFRGASPRWLLEFPTLFHDVSTHTLTDNFRSGATILSHANQLIQRNAQRTNKLPRAQAPYEASVQVRRWSDEVNEALGLAEVINMGQRPPGSEWTIAILARTRLQLQRTATVLQKNTSRRVRFHTFHDAKGKEFDEVHIIGCVEPNPYLHGTDRSTDIEEERRLFYVAMTRCRHSLWLHTTRHCRGIRVRPCPFLMESGLEPKTRK